MGISVKEQNGTLFLVLPATIEALPEVVEPLRAELDARHCPHPTIDHLIVAVEELYVNVAHYAYPVEERPGEVRITYAFPAEGPDANRSVIVTIEDEGVPFDPVAKPDPKLPKSVDEVKIGGLGILMVRRTMDTFTYERRGATNVTIITKRW